MVRRGTPSARRQRVSSRNPPSLTTPLLYSQIRILRVSVPPSAYESAARVCADEGDWKKAVDALVAAEAAGGADCSAVLAVFRRLARELEGGPALDLLDALAPTWPARPPSTRSIATNCAARACARGGRLDDALRLVDEGLRPHLEAGMKIEAGTLDTLAVAAAADGRVDLYDELLEERDYLLD